MAFLSTDIWTLRGGSHQHVGSKCISLYNEETEELICRSYPVYGTVKGAPACPDSDLVVCGRLLFRCSFGTCTRALCTCLGNGVVTGIVSMQMQFMLVLSGFLLPACLKRLPA